VKRRRGVNDPRYAALRQFEIEDVIARFDAAQDPGEARSLQEARIALGSLLATRHSARTNLVKKVAFVFGVIAALLGALWFLQGLGIAHVRPILCFADCAPVQGPSAAWAIIGAIMLAAGAGALIWSLKRRQPPRPKQPFSN
jgi:hypothetical protein